MKGEYRVIIDKRATSEERITTLATALARVDSSAIELPEKVRDVLKTYEPASIAVGSSKHRRPAA